MDLDELQSVRDRERQTDKPQQLRESFYDDVGEFVEQLRGERERAAERHGTYADEVMQLTDEIDAARQLVEDIHERRIGKVVKAASLEAAELSPEVDGLTAEERDLFGALVTDIERHREEVVATVDGETSSPGTGDASATPETGDGSGVSAADVMGSTAGAADTADDTGGSRPRTGDQSDPDPTGERQNETASGGERRAADGAGPRHTDDGTGAGHTSADRTGPTSPGAGDPGGDRSDETAGRAEHALGDTVERERVLVTESVDTFVGSDNRDYDLAAEDVVTLPATNADILVERDVARRL